MKGQTSTVFAILIVALSFMMMLGVFAVSTSFKTKTTKTIDLLFVDAVANKMLLTAAEMKAIVNTTNTQNFTRIISIPDLIGDRPYVILGTGTVLEVRTQDRNAIFIQKNITRVWEAINITGAAGSSGGKVRIDYIKTTGEIRLS